ncbi:preprotein translocase subunit SecG [Caproicibacterium sp. NSD3]
MTGFEIAFGIVLLVFSVAIIFVVLLQEGHDQNTGVINGGADTFLSRNRARTVDVFLSRWTKIIAVGFFIVVIAINATMYFYKG